MIRKRKSEWSDYVKSKQIKQMVVLGVVVLASITGMAKSVNHLVKEYRQKELSGILLRAEKLFLPSLTYLYEDEPEEVESWVYSQAMRLFPMVGYLQDNHIVENETEDKYTYDMILAQQAADENEVDENGNLINNLENQVVAPPVSTSTSPIDMSIESLRNFDYLVNNFYTIDKTTMTSQEELNVDNLLSKNMKINQTNNGPKILIFHSHSQETFVDSVEGDPNTSIVGVGAYLAQVLNDQYHIPTLHHDGVYDIINGKLDRSASYEYAEAGIRPILEANPSIEVVIDLHRDGVDASTHLVTDVNGQQTARIMFFNGLSRTKSKGDIAYLTNPYLQDNLAFSLQMELAAESKYPGFARHIYLKGYRYNLHLMPKSLLVEAGAQTNTVGEMKNAMNVLADILHDVLVE
ncbi:stage II sporulation protein P [Lachnospiraceae bacterium LCP25S3_G4]